MADRSFRRGFYCQQTGVAWRRPGLGFVARLPWLLVPGRTMLAQRKARACHQRCGPVAETAQAILRTLRSLLRRPRISFHARRRREKYMDTPCVMLSDAEITSRARRRREIPVYPSPAMLPRADIARTLLRYRYDREFRGPRRVPIKTLAGYVGLSHETLFQAMRGKISDVTRAKLSWAIVAIAKGRLRFHRHGQVWQIETTAPLAIGLTRATGAQF